MRESGILAPIFSLPSDNGIGDFGCCEKFIDILKIGGQKLWQVLPLVQTGYGNSPYSSVSSKSFNPYFISPEILLKEKLITEEEASFTKYNGKYIDYGFLYSVRFPLLRKAFSRFDTEEKDFREFVCGKTAYDYSLYMSLKYASGQKHFYEWEDKFKYRDKAALLRFASDYESELLFWQFVQYEGRKQWFAVKKYANDNGIKIIGDIPLYVALDSVDVWCNPELFKLNSDFSPKKVAGVPPDFFQAKGQLWGNPVYDYELQKTDGFKWWTDRLCETLEIFDFVRIDHFRGLDRFYEVPFGAPDAMNGEWIKVPSDELFNAFHKKIDKKRIIAEDLGIIDDGVRELLAKTGYPGMKILDFAFNGEKDNLYLPENIPENSVCYTGTHDNDTLIGMIEGASEWDKNNIVNGVSNSLEKMNVQGETNASSELCQSVIELGLASKAKIFIVPLQDILFCDSDYRINEPGTVKPQNWAVRFSEEELNENVFVNLKKITKKYGRCR